VIVLGGTNGLRLVIKVDSSVQLAREQLRRHASLLR
jgi:hypothetical protein